MTEKEKEQICRWWHNHELTGFRKTFSGKTYPSTADIQEFGWFIDSLEEEPKPKFKVGDTIRHKEENDLFKVLAIEDDCYKLENNIVVSIAAQDSWELVEKPVSEDFDKEEYQKCCDSPAYFFNNYVLVKDSNGNWVKPNPVTDEQITEVAEKAHKEEWKRRDSMRCEMAKTIMKLFPEVFKGKILLSSRIKEK